MQTFDLTEEFKKQPESIFDKNRLENILKDYYLGDQPKIRRMMKAYEVGTVDILLNDDRNIFTKNKLINKLVLLEDMQEEKAVEAVNEWYTLLSEEDVCIIKNKLRNEDLSDLKRKYMDNSCSPHRTEIFTENNTSVMNQEGSSQEVITDNKEDADSDRIKGGVHKQNRKNTKAVVAGILFLSIIIVLLVIVFRNKNTSTDTEVKNEMNKTDNSNTEKSVIDNYKTFISSNKAYSFIKDRINSGTNNKYLCQEHTDGCLGFYIEGETEYSCILSCVDAKMNDIHIYSSEKPYCIVFYSHGKLQKEAMACFIQSFYEDLSYDDAMKLLNIQLQKCENQKGKKKLACPINGNLFYIDPLNETNQLKLFIFSDNLDYANIDPVTALGLIYVSDDEAVKEIVTLSKDTASTLLKYYREHEEDNLSDFEILKSKVF